MAEAPALPLWTDAYLADTGHLTTLEHGAYLLLLMTMWRSGGTLANDDKKLARYCRLTTGQWTRIKPTIMEFFQVSSDSITQGRLTDELVHVRQVRKKQSENARAKYRKTNDTEPAMGEPKSDLAEPDGCQPAAPIPIPIEKGISNDIPKKNAKALPKKPQVAGTRLPEDWWPSEELIEWALNETGLYKQQIRDQTERFRDYWFGKTGKDATKRDWSATWRNWIRRANDDRSSSNAKSTRDVTGTDDLKRKLAEQHQELFGGGSQDLGRVERGTSGDEASQEREHGSSGAVIDQRLGRVS